MKEFILEVCKKMALCLFLLGVSMGEAAEKPWVTIAMNQIEIAFPHQPTEMEFDIPFQNTPPDGQLHVLSCATSDSVFLFASLIHPSLGDNILQKKPFKQLFETVFVPRLFFYPQLFKRDQTFEAAEQEGSLQFIFSYLDKNEKRLVKGLAFRKNDRLYILLYIATEAHFSEVEWEHFAGSLIL